MEKSSANTEGVDMDLYSRQIGAFGLETMSRLVKLRVLVMGLRGLGMEICKNLILAGPKSVTLWDPFPCRSRDKSHNPYITSDHIFRKITRAKACLAPFRELNPYVEVNVDTRDLFVKFSDQDDFEDWDLVVVTEVFKYSEMVVLNTRLRERGKGFIFTSIRGFLGFCFTDFSPNHVIFDNNGEPCKSVLVSSITRYGEVATQEDKRHDLEEGDLVRFSEVVGMESLNGKTFRVQSCPTPFTLRLEGLHTVLGIHENYIRNGILTQVKAKVNPNFRGLQDSLLDMDPAEFSSPAELDFEHMNRTLHMKFILSKILRNQKLFVSKSFNFDRRKIEKSADLLEQFLMSDEKIEESAITEWKLGFEPDLTMKVLTYWHVHLAPMCSLWGGIVAQEIVKFTGKFTPVNQWLIHEYYSTIYRGLSMEDLKPRLSLSAKYKEHEQRDLILMIGEDAYNRLIKSKLFMVGAGALGCEYLKMFALMGVASDESGLITVTDDDSIENSNLNRQFLFRKHHLGSFKSQIAVEAAKEFNPSIHAKALTSRVGSKTENVFTDQFFDSLDLIVNAVDNVQAREYVDSKAVLHSKWLFEAGTLGTKCNSQMIIPGRTESYSDSKDPEETGVPMCTLRNFPFLIEHCIEWSREHFFTEFSTASRELAAFLEKPDSYFDALRKEAKTNAVAVTDRIQGLEKLAALAKQPSVNQMVHFMRRDFDNCFDLQIEKLLQLFPAEYRDKHGQLFWSSPKRPPSPLKFDLEKDAHLGYIQTGLQLLSQIFVQTEVSKLTKEEIQAHLEDYQPEQLVEPEDTEEAQKKMTDETAQKADQDLPGRIDAIEAVTADIDRELKVAVLEFEKDDDSNGHIDFITLASNSRAENYQIESAPRHKIKLIAGKIIPAIATTTAMVVGAMGMEMLKYYMKCEFESFRNLFSNLGIAFLNFSEPFPPKVTKDKEYDVIMMGPVKALPTGWDTWSRVNVEGNRMTVEQLVLKLNDQFGVKVESISMDKSIVWSSYGMGEERYQQVLEDIYKELGGVCYKGRKYYVFIAGAVDEKDTTILLPPIVYTVTKDESENEVEEGPTETGQPNDAEENQEEKEPEAEEPVEEKNDEEPDAPVEKGDEAESDAKAEGEDDAKPDAPAEGGDQPEPDAPAEGGDDAKPEETVEKDDKAEGEAKNETQEKPDNQ